MVNRSPESVSVSFASRMLSFRRTWSAFLMLANICSGASVCCVSQNFYISCHTSAKIIFRDFPWGMHHTLTVYYVCLLWELWPKPMSKDGPSLPIYRKWALMALISAFTKPMLPSSETRNFATHGKHHKCEALISRLEFNCTFPAAWCGISFCDWHGTL